MSISKLVTWIQDNPWETWLIVGLLCMVAAMATLVVASATGMVDPGTGHQLAYATPGLGR